MIGLGEWYAVSQTDPRAVALYQRHYSARKGNRTSGIAGAGETLTLLTVAADALWVWRTEHWLGEGEHTFIGRPDSLACGVFRNESRTLSSELVKEADALADARWPSRDRHYTWVDPASIRSTNPGACFKYAGWKDTGMRSNKGLVLLARE